MSQRMSAAGQAMRRIHAPVAFAAAAAAVVPLLCAVNPNTTHVPLCPLHALTGRDCPLCGSTRATYALMHGQLATALRDNSLYVLGLPFLMYMWWRWYLAERSNAPRGRLLPRPVLAAIVALGVVFGVVRNLPFAWWLAPAE